MIGLSFRSLKNVIYDPEDDHFYTPWLVGVISEEEIDGVISNK